MRLLDLDPRWAVSSEAPRGRDGMGVTFDCPHCRTTRLYVFFANPVDGGPAAKVEKLWQRTGETFADLSLQPSIDASKSGHWHGFITNGAIA